MAALAVVTGKVDQHRDGGTEDRAIPPEEWDFAIFPLVEAFREEGTPLPGRVERRGKAVSPVLSRVKSLHTFDPGCGTRGLAQIDGGRITEVLGLKFFDYSGMPRPEAVQAPIGANGGRV